MSRATDKESYEAIFSTYEMLNICNARYAASLHWVRIGLVNKKLPGVRWEGIKWTLNDLYHMRIVCVLRAWHFKSDEIREVIRGLPYADKFLFINIDNKGIKQYTWNKEAQKQAAQNETVFCLNVEQVKIELKQACAKVLADRVRIEEEWDRTYEPTRM